jgi:hypothetical protein
VRFQVNQSTQTNKTMNNEEIIRQKMAAGLSREQAEVVVAADEKSRREGIRFEASLIPNHLTEARRSVERAKKTLCEVEVMCEKKQAALDELEALEAKEAQSALSEKEKAQIIEDAEQREADLIAAAEAAAAEAVAAEAAAAEAVAAEAAAAAAAESAAAESAAAESAAAEAAAKGKKGKKGE